MSHPRTISSSPRGVGGPRVGPRPFGTLVISQKGTGAPQIRSSLPIAAPTWPHATAALRNTPGSDLKLIPTHYFPTCWQRETLSREDLVKCSLSTAPDILKSVPRPDKISMETCLCTALQKPTVIERCGGEPHTLFLFPDGKDHGYHTGSQLASSALGLKVPGILRMSPSDRS